MTEAIIVALITGGISLIGTLATTRSSAKSTQALVDYAYGWEEVTSDE